VCTPVTPSVSYLSTELTGCSMDPGISCGARKLAWTPQVKKKKKTLLAGSETSSLPFSSRLEISIYPRCDGKSELSAYLFYDCRVRMFNFTVLITDNYTEYPSIFNYILYSNFIHRIIFYIFKKKFNKQYLII
jgi:hypothetical protein